MNGLNDFKLYLFLFIPLLSIVGCLAHRRMESRPVMIHTAPENGLISLEIEFQKGKSFNHPSFAVWVEDLEGNYIETLYVTQYVARGKFGHAEMAPGKWKNESGEARRPATLPYWAHKRNKKAPDGLLVPSPETAVPDALTSATPKTDFVLETTTGYSENKRFRVLFEINQPWDSNEFWTNNKFPDDRDYHTSLQPALIYSVMVNADDKNEEYHLNPIGHSHPTGADGKLFTDLSTLTTALHIAQKIIVKLK
jgi:hypothetical protein